MKRWAVLLAALLGWAWADGTPPISIVAGGDVILGRGVAASARSGRVNPLAGVAGLFKSADLSFVNLESPLTRAARASSGIDLRADPTAARSLHAAGVTLVSTVNNHQWDGGVMGQAASRQSLRRAGVTPLAGQVVFTPLAGQRLAWVALQDDSRPWPWAALCQAARTSDALIVSVHWGMEYREVTQRQRTLARQLSASGVRVILGHGPHVLQPVERLGRTLVIYSLGNLAFDSDMPATRRSALLKVVLTAQSVQVCAFPLRLQRALPERVRAGAAQRVFAALQVPPCAS